MNRRPLTPTPTRAVHDNPTRTQAGFWAGIATIALIVVALSALPSERHFGLQLSLTAGFQGATQPWILRLLSRTSDRARTARRSNSELR